MAEADGQGPTQDFLRAAARELKLWILAGTIVIRGESDGRVTNSSLLFDADGNRAARYDKIHLFDVGIPGRNEQYRESTHVAPGDKVVLADVSFVIRCCLPRLAQWGSICSLKHHYT